MLPATIFTITVTCARQELLNSALHLAFYCISSSKTSESSHLCWSVICRTRPELEERLRAARESTGTGGSFFGKAKELAQQVPAAASSIPAAICNPIASVEQIFSQVSISSRRQISRPINFQASNGPPEYANMSQCQLKHHA